MVEHGFQELVFEDAMEVIVDQLNALGTQDPLTIVSLENNMRDGMLSNMVIMYMRMLTSCETQRRQDFFAPFIMVGSHMSSTIWAALTLSLGRDGSPAWCTQVIMVPAAVQCSDQTT